jgi:cell division protein FtsL
MTLVPADDTLRVRVGPKVFADVPSAAELADARKGRGQMAVWLVLLLGMLISTAAFLVFQLMTAGTVKADLEKQVEDAQEEVTRTKADYARLEGRLAELGEYERIDALSNQAAALRADIAKMLADPARADLRTRIPARDWRVYDTPFPSWKDDVEGRLNTHVTELQAFANRVESMGPRLPAADPRGADPRAQ